MWNDFFVLALGNLKHRGLRSWLTILGIFIGIASLVALISLGEALQTAVTGQFSTLSTDKLVVQAAGTGFGPPGSTAVRKLNSNDIKIIESVNGVDLVIGRLIRVGKIEYNKIASFGYIADIPDTKEGERVVYESMNIKLKEGRLLEYNDRGKIILGSNYLDETKFDKKIKVGDNLKIQGKDFEVVGILEKSSSFQINMIIMMANEDIKKLLDIGDETDLILVKIQDRNLADEIASEIKRKMRDDRNQKIGEEDFSVQTPLQTISSINTILNIINYIIIGIAAISLIVGAIGIMNTMYTSVLERTKEIGIMKAIGAKNSDVLWIFLIESGLLGLVGGIIGVILGLSMAIGVSEVTNSFFSGFEFKVSISWYLILFSVLFSFILGIIAGILPAMQASRLKPVEALRQ